MTKTACLCPLAEESGAPIQSFSGGSTRPLVNPIDFSYLWDNFGQLLLDSWIVWATELIFGIAYIVLAVYVRRKDKADIEKVITYVLFTLWVYLGLWPDLLKCTLVKSHIQFIISVDCFALG